MCTLSFREIEALPTIVRFQKEDGTQINIFFGRTSSEVGFEVQHGQDVYSLGEIIGISDEEAGNAYRRYVAVSPEGLLEALSHLAKLVKRYFVSGIQREFEFFSSLRRRRKRLAAAYAMDVMSRQLRPQAADAFRKGQYGSAAKLYDQIKSTLSAAELKKLEYATKKSG